ncbi:MAG: TetR family transcriptional regulator [Solirubrobacterales bacterium]|nr:TetR family transcriptional regulator [Solirubrobacterales bacterium]
MRGRRRRRSRRPTPCRCSERRAWSAGGRRSSCRPRCGQAARAPSRRGRSGRGRAVPRARRSACRAPARGPRGRGRGCDCRWYVVCLSRTSYVDDSSTLYEVSSEVSQTIWDRPEPGARRAAYTREQIALAAIAIADAEGFKAVSMRRVAAELGAGTMTLYHYVRNKGELIDLIDDAIMGELLIEDGEMPADWREALGEISRRTKAAFLRHPWTIEIPPGTEGGPNGVKHFDQTLAALAGTGLGPMERLELSALVDDYVFGFSLRHNRVVAMVEGGPAGLAERASDVVRGRWSELIRERIAALSADEYPHVHEMFTGRDPVDVITEMIEGAFSEDRFERGLELLLDGIERRIERDSGAA